MHSPASANFRYRSHLLDRRFTWSLTGVPFVPLKGLSLWSHFKCKQNFDDIFVSATQLHINFKPFGENYSSFWNIHTYTQHSWKCLNTPHTFLSLPLVVLCICIWKINLIFTLHREVFILVFLYIYINFILCTILH